MTAIYSINARLTASERITTRSFKALDVTAIVPAYNDQDGLTETLESLDELSLAEIIVIDDGSKSPLLPPPRLVTKIRIIRHSTNRGAAAARNSGLEATVSDWVYFTDCGCTHHKNIVGLFSAHHNPFTVAICGPVEARGHGRIAHYYTHQGTLNAPMKILGRNKYEVETIVTANTLVNLDAVRFVGKFDESFPSAGGEDTDLGIRLRTIGEIEWCEPAKVTHSFLECLSDFDSRMKRYGRGMFLVSEKLGLDLRPRPFQAFAPSFNDLAERQHKMMLEGFNGSPETHEE